MPSDPHQDPFNPAATPVLDPDQSPENTKSSGSKTALYVILAVAAVGLVGVFSLFSNNGDSDDATVGASSIYDFPLAGIDGETTSLASHEGKPLVVNYFAAWCPPCRRELPDFEAVHQRLGDKVSIVGISRDNTTGAWISLVESTGLTYETLFEGNVAGSYDYVDGLAMPTTAFIDADGELKYTFSGALDEDSLVDLIDEHLLNPNGRD